MKMNRLFILLIILGCARVGYPPGKPEINKPQTEANIPSTFKSFPIEIKLKIKDDTKIKNLKIHVNDNRIVDIQIDRSYIDTTIIVDTLKNFSDTIGIYNFKFEVSDIYDNIEQKQITINYKKEENKPKIEILDTNFSKATFKLKVHLMDDTRLKNFFILKDDSILKNFALISNDTTLDLELDSMSIKALRLKAEDIYLNFSEMHLVR